MANYVADLLRRPFYNATDGWTHFLPLPLSIPLRAFAIWSNPDDYVEEAGKAEPVAIDTSKTITLMTWNILGFHAGQTQDEGRPHWKDAVEGADRRIDKVIGKINDLKPLVMGTQEMHGGSELDGALHEGTTAHFSKYFTDVLPKAIMFGSGITMATRFSNTTFAAYDFEVKGGNDAKFVRKGFGVLSVRNSEDQLVMRIASAHFQSNPSQEEADELGSDESNLALVKHNIDADMMERAHALDSRATGTTLNSIQIRDLQARQVINTMRALDTDEPARANFLMGDLNVNRCSELDMAPWGDGSTSVLDPDAGEVMDGFYRGAGHRAENQLTPTDCTQVDIGKEPEAVDNIVAIRKETGGDAGCTLVTTGVSSYEHFNDPSDHMALFAEVELT